jgi:hypothetical protein
MKLKRLSALAEIISSIAILLTLAYLAVQTKQTSNALYANSRATTMSADISLQAAMLDHPEITERLIVPVGIDPPPDFSVGGMNLLVSFLRIREFAWFQYRNGILDESAFRSYMGSVRSLLGSELGQQYWPILQNSFDPDFVERVNAILAGADP